MTRRTQNTSSGDCFVGIDIGSVSTCVVALTGDTPEVAFRAVFDTGPSASRAAARVLDMLAREPEIRQPDITAAVATGFGRHSVPFAGRAVSEITCHARGILFSAPETRTLVDIGGQDSKVIRLDRSGGVRQFAMNDRCAAGTGRFVETMARVLGDDLASLNAAALGAADVLKINATCTVFAESEVVSLISDNVPVGDIMAAVFRAIGKRTLGMIKRVGGAPPFAMSGGVGMNPGLVKALENILQHPVRVARDSQAVGALGAALIAHETFHDRDVPAISIAGSPGHAGAPKDSFTADSQKTSESIAVVEPGEKSLLVLCSCFPREILHALNIPNRVADAGVQPGESMGAPGSESVADSIFSEMHPQLCSVAAAKLGTVMAARDKKELLGVLAVDTCDAKRRLYDYMKDAMPDGFVTMAAMPPRGHSLDVAYYATSLRQLAHRLGRQFNRPVSDEALWGAIESTNRVRALFRELLHRHRTGTVGIPGARLSELFHAALTRPPGEVAALLEETLAPGGQSGREPDALPTLALIGSCAGFSRIAAMVGGKAHVLLFDHCFGQRPWTGQIETGHADPYTAIAEYVLAYQSCPRCLDKTKRLRDVLGRVCGVRADGVIGFYPKFCIPEATDTQWILSELQRLGFDTLELEIQGDNEADGQLATRCDAWLESLSSKAEI